jgi:sugar phosphate isomerase/epimerase
VRLADGTHLTYCSNIHPGESWPELREVLRGPVPAVKAALGAQAPFAIGLRVAGAASEALDEPQARDELRQLLDAAGLYVFTINGFPYGAFHGQRVKEEVYLPDWRDEERLRYTDRLADLLAALLPPGAGLGGSISTVPGAFKPNASTEADVDCMAELMVRHVAKLVEVRERTGASIALALEPEPCCFLETIEETVAFFERHLHSARAAGRLRALTGLGAEAAERALREHLGVCLDLCHAAVEFEDPARMIDRLRGAGVAVSKLQISAGLRLAEVGPATRAALEPYNDEVYLHQVVERRGERLERYVDLPEAFAALAGSDAGQREWRVHFHVPVFMDDLGAFQSTQAFLAEVLDAQRENPISQHLEVETYTWDVLPEALRRDGVVAAVARELAWVLERLGAAR